MQMRSAKKSLFQPAKGAPISLEGMPFRDAYKSVGIEVNEGKFRYQGAEGKTNGQLTPADLKHSSMRSLGNLCTERILAKMEAAARFT